MSQASNPSAAQDAIQAAHDNISAIYQIIERQNKVIAELRNELDEVRAKGARIGWAH